MKKFSQILVACVMLTTFISCERYTSVDKQSPIKGVWECPIDGLPMTLTFGDHEVEYKLYIEFFKATAIYNGTYTIKEKNITIDFTSLSTKNSSQIEYKSPENMPKEAVLKDENTILYMDNIYTRK